jgi:hypothetical protein
MVFLRLIAFRDEPQYHLARLPGDDDLDHLKRDTATTCAPTLTRLP